MIGLIGGTGLGEALLGTNAGEERVLDTPFGPPSGPLRLCQWHGLDLAILARHGDGHVYNPSQVPYRANIYALKSLGVTHIIASGAVGSLREEYRPRDLVIVDQVIDKTYRRAPTFFDDGLVAHVEFARPYCDELRQVLLQAGADLPTTVHAQGTYVCMEGPAFSTVAEANMHRLWGGDVIGMTSMPEAKLAREAEIAYALIALVTDYDCWKPHAPGTPKQQLLEEIIGHLHAATQNAVTLMRAAIGLIAAQGAPASAAHTALDLGVWTQPARQTPHVLDRYGVLLERYRRAPGRAS
jgi:5'-methylthioadenosine phosphorylase